MKNAALNDKTGLVA